MAPLWVKDLAPAPPQGINLIAEERAKSNLDVDKLSTFLFTKEVLGRQNRILQLLKGE
jgi:acyl-CoA oxidase